MTRGLNPLTQAEIAAKSQRVCSLFYMGFSTPERITSAGFDFTWGVDVFKSTGHILSVSSVTESTETRVGTMTLELSTADQYYIGLFLNNPYVDVPFQYWRAWFDKNYQLVGDPVEYFAGTISNPLGSERGKKSSMTIKAASHWAQWQYRNSVHTNLASQQIHYPNDMCFEYSSESLRDIKWGRD